MNQTIIEAVLEHGKHMPDKLCVAFKTNCLTYGEVCERMRAAAGILRDEYGIQKGDKIMLSAMSKVDYIIAYLGIQYLGAVSIPIDKAAKEDNIKDMLDFIQPQLLLTDGRIQPENARKKSLKEIFAESGEEMAIQRGKEIPYEKREMEETAEMLFTTGTTGVPKGAMLTCGNLLASTQNTWHGVSMEPSDVVLIPLPLNHSVGMRVLRCALYIGATIIIQNGFTFAKDLEKNISTFQCTALVSVPASIELVYRQMQDKFAEILGVLRYIEFGAGSLSYDMKKKLTKLLPNTTIYNTWGSTETGGAIFLNVTKHPDKLTSLGKPVDGIKLKVVNTEGESVEARDINTAGRMVLQGPMQMKGYYHLPEENEKTLVDGWLYTNDMIYTDEEGYVYMLGRADDIINVGGEKVSPIEVENIAQEYEEIKECACIGVPDPDEVLGQVPILYIVTENGPVNQERLTKFLAGRMEKYKLPQVYVPVEQLPRNRMQKLDRKELYRLWEEVGEENLMNDMLQMICSRHSVRDFTEEHIPKAYLEMIVKAGIYAPNGHNLQTWRFTVIRNREKVMRLRDMIECVAKEQKVDFYGFRNPDTVILVSNDRRNKNTVQDVACAVENMMLAAHSYGIGSAWNNALSELSDVKEIRELLDEWGVPKTHIVWSALLMGYPQKQVSSPARKMDVVTWVEED